MSDIRFIMIGVALVFVGFIILGVLGSKYQAATFEANEFGTCHEYSDNAPPTEINCSFKIMDQTLFFALVIGFLGAGVISLVKGTRGDWDNKVNPEDMAGPGRRENESSDKD